MPYDSDDEAKLLTDPASGSAGNASKTIIFYSLGLGRNSPHDFHGIINRRKHHSGSEV